MSFAAFLLKKINVQHKPIEINSAVCSPVEMPKGAIRVKKNGEIDKRSLQRGKRKEWDKVPRGVRAYEHVILRDIMEKARPGEEYAWGWRTPQTRDDVRLRNNQVSYAYKIANIYGHKVSISAKTKHIVIRYICKINEDIA